MWAELFYLRQDAEVKGRDIVEPLLGFWPKLGICLSTGRDDGALEKAAGRCAWALAERFGGLIDFQGSIVPPLRPERRRWSESRQHRLAEVNAFVQEFPGTVKEWFYRQENGRRWVHHFADAEFMLAWLRHPSFHLVK
ncbi:MAG: DUF6368 family protein [Actinomycetota bacterium]